MFGLSYVKLFISNDVHQSMFKVSVHRSKSYFATMVPVTLKIIMALRHRTVKVLGA